MDHFVDICQPNSFQAVFSCDVVVLHVLVVDVEDEVDAFYMEGF